jgi:dTDP-4-amino-4,6-dideoxygalactose transaminase
MEGVRCVTFPDYPEGDLPSYHMLTMNFQPEVAGVSRSTYLEALRAEGVPAFSYVPAPISQWKRLQWQDYDGPKVMWTESLRQAGIDYSQVEVPNAELKIARSIEISWNYVDVDEAKMQRMAAAFEKVEANLDALRQWEQARED